MSDNIGRTILLIFAIFLGIIAFVYIGIPIIKVVLILVVKLIWGIAALLSEFVRIIIIITLLIATVIAVWTFIMWLFEEKQGHSG